MTTALEIAAATTFLKVKLREFVSQSNVPALAAVLVREAGSTIVSGQQGIRKVGATGDQNTVQDTDRFKTGSVSKLIAAHLIGALIDANDLNPKQGLEVPAPGLDWTMTLGVAFPEWSFPVQAYKNVTIDQYTAHVSGMPGGPAQFPGDDDWKNSIPEEMSDNDRIQMRLLYVKHAILDPLVCQPGDCVLYSGGQVINAAILERLTGVPFEDLVDKYVFGPLNMTHSRFGRPSKGALDGPWLHTWDGETFKVVPDTEVQLPGDDVHPRNPVGGWCCSAADLGRFLAESVSSDPQAVTLDTLQSMQSKQVSPKSNYVRGAWSSNKPGNTTADLSYTGNGGAELAIVSVSLLKKTANGAMCNMNDTFASAATLDILETCAAIDLHWSEFVHAGHPEPRECAHAMPALVVTREHGRNLIVFGRKHTGKLIRRYSNDSGVSWGKEVSFGDWTMTSGLAATATKDGEQVFLFGRGTNNQIWFGTSPDSGITWQGSWGVPFGTFMTGPAVGISADGKILHLVAVGMNRRMYHIQATRAADGVLHWGEPETIGQGVFTSAPAITVSSDGSFVHVFGRGDDFRFWHNWKTGKSWQPHWTPIGKGVFTSGPGAAASDNGAVVHVIGRGTDRQMWRNQSNALGTWQPHWTQFSPSWELISAPAVAMHGSNLYLAAFATDFTIWTNHSGDSGQTWDGFKQVGPEHFF